MENEKTKASPISAGKLAEKDRSGGKETRKFEEDCIMKCLGGDNEAFRPLVERYSTSLYTFIYRMIGSREDSEEIVQEAFTRAFRNLVDFNPRYRFSTWLYSIALNLCRDHVRKQERNFSNRRVDLDVSNIKSIDPVEHKVDTKRRYEKLLACLDLLPRKYREAIIMKDVMMFPYKEIQKNLHLPVPVLKIRVIRARRKLIDLISAAEGVGKNDV